MSICFHMLPACGRQADRQTDGQMALSMAKSCSSTAEHNKIRNMHRVHQRCNSNANNCTHIMWCSEK